MLSTREMADRLGVEPRKLRQFLRSAESTFHAVGSAARYEFKESEVDTVARRFQVWSSRGKSTTPSVKITSTVSKPAPPQPRRVLPTDRDIQVWIEEGTAYADGTPVPLELADINDPGVRRRVRAEAEAANAYLNSLLMAKGMHVTQLSRKTKAA